MITIENIRKRRLKGKVVIEAEISSERLRFSKFKLWYKFDSRIERYLSLNVDPFIAALVIPSMYADEDLETDYPVSEKFLTNIKKAKRLCSSWESYAHWMKIGDNQELFVRSTKERKNIIKRSSALFFTGGVDSFYTMKKLIDGGEHPRLIYVEGFDVQLDDTTILRKVRNMFQAVRNHYRSQSYTVSTNLRQLLNVVGVNWAMSRGAALASVGLFLGGLFDKIYISSSDSYLVPVPYGTHPNLDPLWSNSEIEFVPFGSKDNRFTKMKSIAEDEFVQKWLRVCWERKNEKYNCGICEKCLRTMIQLEVLGCRMKFVDFRGKIHYAFLKDLEEPYHRFYIWDETLRRIPRNQNTETLKKVILKIMRRSRRSYALFLLKAIKTSFMRRRPIKLLHDFAKLLSNCLVLFSYRFR